MSSSTFRLRVGVPRTVQLHVRVNSPGVSRDNFYSWLWREFSSKGLLGIHEGSLLSEEAAEPWVLDAALAPHDRDWVAMQAIAQNDLYFATIEDALRAKEELSVISDLKMGSIEEQKVEDWDAKWKASFTGVSVPPCWEVIPPWVEEEMPPGRIPLKINPGAGFGTGTHETTQLCLGILADVFPGIAAKGVLQAGGNPRVLDFGSGSGILSIAAALLGGNVDGVEVDPMAIDNAQENAILNCMERSIHFFPTLPLLGANPMANHLESSTYRLVVANILKPVLLEFAEELVNRMDTKADLLLSGLLEKDVAEVTERYSKFLGGKVPEVRALGEWRALWWRAS